MGNVVKGLMGAGQSKFQARGADPTQMKTAYNQTQASIQQQQDFVNALAAQNGLSNQSSVFDQQQGLADQFANIAAGQGPNPALAALNQQTGQNIAGQAALMAGQRGAGANTGMMARQAAIQGANTQQQAVGQAATLQAQQQLAALQAQQQQQQQMAALSTQQAQQQQQGISNLGAQAQGQHGQLLGLQQNANQINAQTAASNAAAKGNMIGNLMGAAGTVIAGPLGGAIGGMFSGGGGSSPAHDFSKLNTTAAEGDWANLAEGGEVPPASIVQQGPRSIFGKMMHNIKMAEGGQVPALVSPGEVYLDPNDVNKVKQGANPLTTGEKIPGTPKVKGAKDSYTNDMVPKTLQEGGIVIPRSVTESKDAEAKAHAFISAVLAKSKLKK